jgi:hypothetical protein
MKFLAVKEMHLFNNYLIFYVIYLIEIQMQCASETILMLIVKNIFHIFICNEIITIQLI